MARLTGVIIYCDVFDEVINYDIVVKVLKCFYFNPAISLQHENLLIALMIKTRDIVKFTCCQIYLLSNTEY
jgi:hypothetical protein